MLPCKYFSRFKDADYVNQEVTLRGIQDGIADTPEKMKRYLDTIHTKAEVIDDLVNNLSVFSKLELSRLTFEFKEGDINSFMRDFVDDYRLDLEKNGIKLETDIPTDEVIVRMDYEKNEPSVF